MGREEKEDKAISLAVKEECQDQQGSSNSINATTSRNASSGWNISFSGNASNGKEPSWHNEANKQQQPTTISKEACISRDSHQQQ